MSVKFESVVEVVERAKVDFRRQLSFACETGGLDLQRYQRFLSMQYHLTNGVQKHFFTAAAHPSMLHRKGLRKFLLQFADEEETHYMIAEKDLENLGLKPLDVNMDVRFWCSYFSSVVADRPFIRLGATCVLENIAVGQGDLIRKLVSDAGYLNPRNTRFLTIHQHEELPHGDQIYKALRDSQLGVEELSDLLLGANMGRVMYLRLFHWVLTGTELV